MHPLDTSATLTVDALKQAALEVNIVAIGGIL